MEVNLKIVLDIGNIVTKHPNVNKFPLADSFFTDDFSLLKLSREHPISS